MDIDLIRLIGCSVIAYFVFALLGQIKRMLYTYVFAKMIGDIKNLYGYGHWAVITGSTDGIGKGYAKELARRHMNLLLISRNAEKLEATKKEIGDECTEIEIRTLAFDFGSADLSSYQVVKDAVKDLDIGVLVNNVGASNEYPETFLDYPEAEKTWDRMLKINCSSVTEMTMIILPQMIAKKMGAIINVSSASAYHPCPYLSVYAATKSFVSHFTACLKSEYSNSGVFFQVNFDLRIGEDYFAAKCVYPYFVATNMSKIKRPSYFAPDAETYAKSALNTIGLESETNGCLAHSLQHLIYQLVPRFVYVYMSRKMMLETREKYLRRINSKKEN